MGDVCVVAVPSGPGGHNYPMQVTLRQTSHLSVLFTGEFGGLDPGDEGMLFFRLDGNTLSPGWSYVGSNITRDGATISWTFFNVPRGTHTVEVSAGVGGDGYGQIDRCSLTVTVVSPN